VLRRLSARERHGETADTAGGAGTAAGVACIRDAVSRPGRHHPVVIACPSCCDNMILSHRTRKADWIMFQSVF
jgi:hypothetical protein